MSIATEARIAELEQRVRALEESIQYYLSESDSLKARVAKLELALESRSGKRNG